MRITRESRVSARLARINRAIRKVSLVAERILLTPLGILN
jgi:hypothetical protein